MQNDMGTQYPDLGSVFGMSSNPLAAWYGMQQIDTANQNQQQNLAQHQQQMAFDAQRQPLDLASLQATTAQTTANTGRVNAEIPGIQAASDKAKQDQGIYSQLPADQQLAALKAHIKSTMSDDEYNSRRNEVSQALVNSDDPVKQKQAEQLWPLFREQRTAATAQAAEYKKAVDVADINAKARTDVADIRGSYAATAARNKALPPPKTFQEGAMRAAEEAKAAYAEANGPTTSPADKVRLMQAYQTAAQNYQHFAQQDLIARRQAAGVANSGKPDPNAFDVSTIPGPDGALPLPGAPAPVAPPVQTGPVIMTDNSGVDHVVPAGAVTSAIKQGWKKK